MIDKAIRVILDTNVLIVSIPTKSKYRPIFDAILSGKLELVISNDILNEYIEIIERKTNSYSIANNIGEALLNSNYVLQTEVKFNWNLIEIDKDDNKFVDAYISGNANILVTNDKHFDVLEKIIFTKVVLMNLDHFLELLTN